MRQTHPHGILDRRSFMKVLAGFGGAAIATGLTGASVASAADALGFGSVPFGLRDQIGLQLFTVRDLTAQDYPGTLLKVGQIGYKEVQTTGSYGDHTPQQMRQYLDRAGLIAPTTHVSPPMGAEMERTLEGYQLIGHKYTTVRLTSGGGRGGAPRAPGATARGSGAQGATPRPAGAPTQRPPAPPQTLDSVKRTAEQLNQAGLITKKHGMKIILHNHTEEFEPLADSSLRPYDVILAETDPELVAMELDIGWAAVAGQNAVEMFQRNPGRFEVWHVKDIAGLAALEGLQIQERRRGARIVPMGEGDLDYRPIFAQATLAGMKHYYVEQDTAPQSGDSMAAAAKSYQNLMQVLA